VALFPFPQGRLVEVREVTTPQHIPVSRDYLLLFQVEDFILKVLHVKPWLKVGDRVKWGEEIGELVLSGFFTPWSDKHAHFEFRSPQDPYRARGGIPVVPKWLELVPAARSSLFVVQENKENYCWLAPLETGPKGLTPWGNVEGGLPYYRYGALFHSTKGQVLDREVVAQETLDNGAGIFRPDFTVKVNGRPVKGIGVYCNEPRLKLVGGNFREGETVVVELVPSCQQDQTRKRWGGSYGEDR